MKAILLSIFCSAMLAMGQICWKLSLKGDVHIASLKTAVLYVFSPLFLAGAFLYIIATVFWLYLLSKFELSYIYPMISFAYVFGAILAAVILKEHIYWTRIGGTALIVLGIVAIGLGK
ncbi:MAG: EamA family transporter [Candidatus Cloacimonas sp.]